MNWKVTQLSNIADIERKSISPDNIVNGTFYVGLEHISSAGNFVDVSDVSNGDLASNKFVFDEKHVLFGKLRPYLNKIARPNFSGICSTDILPIRPRKELDRSFLYYWLRTPEMVGLSTNRSSGANLPRLSPKELAKFPIPLPPFPEQKRIAAILDQADALREK
ncbi:restriction endonuclease subunit S [Marispirochaeta sp.]|uniref:restriction endonuclease subunit S n=1 Tax=Marispirochaeta sp. TaxID=2038653 RepID=UPI0029C9715B|nr:restriction endonuclease subunit S [Marispirochaeta sp.]